VTVTENGKRRQVTKREAVIAQLVNKSAAAEMRATIGWCRTACSPIPCPRMWD
jgi:hypothetical protein